MRLPALVVLLVLAAPAALALAGEAPVAAPSASPALVDAGDPVGPVWPYHTWETLTLELQELVAAHPDIARLHSAGKSTLGFDLWVVEIADFMNPDRVPLEQREVVWLDGGTHANEQLGMMLAFLWVEFLLEEYATNDTARFAVEQRHTFIMPMVNPDGNHLDSRTNANLVNINRNYPVGWGKVDERLVGNNPGPYAMSEPETQAVVRWVKAVQPDYFNSFHTGTNMMLFPVGYAEVQAPDHLMFQRICDELGETDADFCGPVFSTIYPASGIAVDTAYFETGAVAWTYEVDDEGFLYWSLEDPRLRMDRYWRGVEHAFLNVERYGAHLRLASLRLVDDLRGDYVVETVVENDGYGPLAWGEVQVRLPNGASALATVGPLASGASEPLRLTFPREGEAREGELQVGFRYPKRVVAAPMADTLLEVPVLRDAGRLVAEVVPVRPLGDAEAEARSVPGAEAGAVLAALGAVALAARRRRA